MAARPSTTTNPAAAAWRRAAGLADPIGTVTEMEKVGAIPEIGLVLRGHRLRAGLTQETLAERAGLGTRSIQAFEGGERRPHQATVQRLADALGLDGLERTAFEAAARPAPRHGAPISPFGRPEEPPTGRRRSRDTGRRLPVPLTGFVGREREVTEVERRLASSRLVTLTGPPGVGKTRLALRVAAGLVDDFADGVRFVPLAPIRDPELVVSAIAASLGVEGFQAAERQPLLDRVADALRDRRCLLVLDNFEQVAAGAPRVAALLEACPRLAVLVTSRTRLRLRGECEVVVPPLTLPGTGDPSRGSRDPASPAGRSEAVRLFIERAREAGNDLDVDGEHAVAIAEICRHVDGLPLAIELAAAWCKVLAPPTLLKRLTGRLAFLTAGAADLPPRQRTLRAAIDWSHELLSGAEQGLFRRLAVFAGGFGAEAAEAIAGATLADLAGLVDKSLVQRTGQPGDEPRFAMLETVREYALERLAAGGEAEALRRRHAGYFRVFAASAKARFAEGRDTTWLDRLEREHDNLRAALRFLLDTGDAEQALWTADPTDRLWAMRSRVDEARLWLAEMLELATSAGRGADRAEVLRASGRVASLHGDHAAARARLEESLLLSRQEGDRHGVAEALAFLGLCAHEQGDYPVARAHSQESLELFRELGDAWGVGAQLDRVGMTAFYQGDVATAHALLQESLDVRRKLGDPIWLAWSVMLLGQVAHAEGDHATARARYEESLAVWRKYGYRLGIADALAGLGDLAVDEGDLVSARALLLEGLGVSDALGYPSGVELVLEALGGLAAARDEPERALRFGGAAAALRRVTGERCPPDFGARLVRRMRQARELLGEEAASAAWAEGEATTPEQAIAYARREWDGEATPAAPIPSS
ncbi:MAG TPA: tetratricopeptide repeat protein [Chloroflexota bacterium]|jgi:predicted ATPase/transcriptional regulator with XRE-family HTH domain